MATCACGVYFRPTEKRTEECKPCAHKRYIREYRRRTYHEVVKPDPDRLERHREQSREAAKRYRERVKQDPVKLEDFRAKRRDYQKRWLAGEVSS